MTAPDFHPLPFEALAHMERQRQFVRTLLARNFPGQTLVGGRADLPLLQKVVDGRILRPDQTWELQSLGIALGDALIGTTPGLAWCEVTDEFGTDPTLRYRQTTYQLNALTMISKRVEQGRPVDLVDLAEQISQTFAKLPEQ